MKGTVFVLEDDSSIAGLIEFALSRENLICRTFSTVRDFKTGLLQTFPDVAMLDVMLPDGNGLDVLKEMKQFYPSVSLIVVSALGKESDKVTGLNLGADDYITKPFGIAEMVARVNAALRRKSSNNVLVVGGLELHQDTMTVTLNGKSLDLNRKEFELLRYCMNHTDVVLSREALLTEIWGYMDTESRTLDNHIARLRKLGVDNFETVFGVGYKFRQHEKNG